MEYKNLDESVVAPLHMRYDREVSPQPAYIEIDPEDETVRADYSGEIGNAVPAYIWHRRAVRISVPSCVSAEAINRLFDDEDFRALCDRVVAGYECVWDGSNHVGCYDDDASAAIEDIRDMIEHYFGETDLNQVYEAGDWMREMDMSDIWHPGETIAEAAKRVREEALSEGVLLDGDVARAIRHRAEYDYDCDRLDNYYVQQLGLD